VLPALVDSRRALDDDAPLVRDGGNHIFDWEAGDAGGCARRSSP
jgi:carbon-monoxide dehydrogenase large subunit